MKIPRGWVQGDNPIVNLRLLRTFWRPAWVVVGGRSLTPLIWMARKAWGGGVKANPLLEGGKSICLV